MLEIPSLAPFQIVGSWADYVDCAIGNGERGFIPILLPDARDRRERWLEVLRWYIEKIRPFAPPPPVQAHITVIPSSGLVEPAARFVALGLEAECESLLERKLKCSARTAFESNSIIVGLTSDLDAFVSQGANFTAGSSLLVGRDLPGLTFSIAKAMALRRGLPNNYSTLLADGINHKVARFSVSGSRTDLPYDLTDLEAGNYGAFLAHVHGEGAHGDLDRVVLCGRVGDVERFLDGEPVPNGCSGGRVVYCKRGRKGSKTVSFYDIRSPRLLLLSCNGYTPNGELYPSDLSGPISALEGYAAEVLTTTRAMAFDEGLINELASTTAESIGLAASLNVANRHAAIGGLQHAFILLGISPGSSAQEASKDIVDGVPKLAKDLMAAWAGGRICVRRLAQSLGLQSLERKSLKVAEDAMDVLGMAMSQVSVEEHSSRIMDHAGSIASVAIENVGEALTRHVRRLDHAPDLLSIFAISARREFIGAGELCDRCGSETEIWQLTAWATSEAKALDINCPVCGPRDFYLHTDSPVEVKVPSVVSPGQRLPIEIRVQGPRALVGRGRFLLWLREKSQGNVLYRREIYAEEIGSCVLRIPPNAPPDMMTLTVVHVHGVHIASARRRISCVHRG